MLTYVLHRIGGLGMAIFVTIHILSTFMGTKVGIFTNSIYENWVSKYFSSFLCCSMSSTACVLPSLICSRP